MNYIQLKGGLIKSYWFDDEFYNKNKKIVDELSNIFGSDKCENGDDEYMCQGDITVMLATDDENSSNLCHNWPAMKRQSKSPVYMI